MAMNVTFVGGFGTPSLRFQNAQAKLVRLWYSPLNLARYGPEGLRLAPNGVDPFVPGGLPLIPGPGYEFGVYDLLKQQLVADGWKFSNFAWDWRRSLIGQAQRLAAALATSYGSGTFSIVAHSAGGLLAQLAYPVWQALNTGGTWSRTLYLATPHGGSMWGPAGLGIVLADGYWLYVWLVAYTGFEQLQFPSGLTQDSPARTRLQACLASWPALYDLMPNNLGTWASISPNVARLYQQPTWNAANPFVTVQKLTDAQTTQQRLVDLLSQPRAPEVVVAGTGYETLTGIDADGSPSQADSYVVTAHGDGTVPADRAVLPTSTSIVGPWTHTSIVQDISILNNLTRWLLDPPTQNVVVDAQPLKGVVILPGGVPDGPGLFIPIPGNPVGPNRLGGVDP